MKCFVQTVLVLLLATNVWAGNMKILTPYAGWIQNKLTIPSMGKMDDTEFLSGLYFQSINPVRYQWNTFVYHSQDINASRLLGGHFIFDYYFGVKPSGKFVAGAGMDYIRIDTKDLNVLGITNFNMKNNIYALYARAGRYLQWKTGPHRFSVLGWAGYEQDLLRGDLSFIIPSMSPKMPAMDMRENLDNDHHYALAGAMFNVVLFHFVELKWKYHAKIDLQRDELLHVVSLMTNVYLSRSVGLSHRFKYMEEIIGENGYHLFGLALLF